MPDVSIVIVNYNQRDYTAHCIDSILATPPNAGYGIVLVDNASSDGSADWLAERYPGVKLIRSRVNGGIAGGNNLGIRAGSGKYVLLLNNDTIVLPGSIDRVVAFLNEHPEAAGVGGQLLNPDRTFQGGFYDFPSFAKLILIDSKLPSILWPYYPSHPAGRQVRQVDWISTAFMLFRREALEQVGCVDEEFFIYSDESDLQYRLKKAGWKIYYLPDVKTIHFGGKSLTPWRRRRLVYRGYLLFFKKHYGQAQTVLLRMVFALVSLIKLLVWSFAFLIPGWRERALHELRSNRDILAMVSHAGIEPA